MPKMHQDTLNTYSGWDPLGELMRSPRSLRRNGGLLLRGGWKGRGHTSKGQVLAANEIFLL